MHTHIHMYVFDTRWGGGAIGYWQLVRRKVGNISVLNHEDEPMGRVCTIYAGVHLNLSQFTLNRK